MRLARPIKIDQWHTEAATEHAEHGIFGDDAKVAPEGQLEASCNRMTFDCGDHWLGEVHACGAHRSVRIGRKVSQVAGGNCLEVGARAEIAPRAGQHGNERGLVRVETAERVRQRIRRLRIHGVANLGPVDRHDGDSVHELVANAHHQLRI